MLPAAGAPRSLALLALLAAVGCGARGPGAPQAAAARPEPKAAEASPAVLPPGPVPETFDVAALAERVKPVVVNITTTQILAGLDPEGMDPFEFFFGPRRGHPGERARKRMAAGTGFVIDPEGYIVTNEHVVADASEVVVRLADEREFAAEVVGRDPKLDLALLRIQGAPPLPAATLGSSETLRVGEHVLAVGNPFGLGHTVTLGIVSAKARTIGASEYDDFIQTDASINPGNSGGPLFNWRGEVVGINTAIRPGANSIGFAIPVDALKDVLSQLREKGYVERGRLGVRFQPMTADLARALGLPSPKGALVSDVEPAGPAARAGVRAGDVIVEVGASRVEHATDLARSVARNRPGTAVKLVVLREGQRRELSVVLDRLEDPAPLPARAPRPAPPNAPASSEGRLGLAVADAPGGGVRVEALTEQAELKELMTGDVILELNGAPVRNVEALRAAIVSAKPGSVALLKIRRGQVVRFAALPIPAK